MKLMQCGDDGVSSDVRLVVRLRRHGARATFNLNAGLRARERCFGRRHQDTEVRRLGRDELREVHEGFCVANHALMHPYLDALPIEAVRREVHDGRARLQVLFDQPVRGFVYPFGRFNERLRRPQMRQAHEMALAAQFDSRGPISPQTVRRQVMTLLSTGRCSAGAPTVRPGLGKTSIHRSPASAGR